MFALARGKTKEHVLLVGGIRGKEICSFSGKRRRNELLPLDRMIRGTEGKLVGFFP